MAAPTTPGSGTAAVSPRADLASPAYADFAGPDAHAGPGSAEQANHAAASAAAATQAAITERYRDYREFNAVELGAWRHTVWDCSLVGRTRGVARHSRITRPRVAAMSGALSLLASCPCARA
jgi:hypothetical protein